MFFRSIVILTLLLFPLSCHGKDEGGAPLLEYRVLKKLPHDPAAFTQGLAFKDGLLWEGTLFWHWRGACYGSSSWSAQ